MASTSLNFPFTWKLNWSQYDKIAGSTRDAWPRKRFDTAYKNVVFRWFAQLKPSAANLGQVIFGIYYEDGPLEIMKSFDFEAALVKRDDSIREISTFSGDDYHVTRGEGYSYAFDHNDSVAVRAEYGLRECDPLIFKITMRLPKDAFSYEPPPIELSNPNIRNNLVLARNADRFALIQNPECKFSDVVLISRDEVEFYCHRVIVGQTEPLETILSDPLAGLDEEPQLPTDGRGTKRKANDDSDDNDQASTPAKKKRGYDFSHMAPSSLKALLEYLYIGQSTLQDLTVTELIEVADSAEQYLLKQLKDSCAVILWKRVATEPESAFEIVRFADLHEDSKYLKHRALDVLVENYQYLDINPKLLPVRFGGTRGEELKDELMDYMVRRRCPYDDDVFIVR